MTSFKKRALSPVSDRSKDSDTEIHALDDIATLCDGCNKQHQGGRASCRFRDHPNFNAKGSFKESATKKLFEAFNRKNPTQQPVTSIWWNRKFLKDGTYEKYTPPNAKQADKKSKKVSFNSELTYIKIPYVYNTDYPNIDALMAVELSQAMECQVFNEKGSLLIDTGAIRRSYISGKVS